MKRLHLILGAFAIAVLAAGCSSPVKLEEKTDVPVESRTPTPVGGAGAAAGAGQGTAGASQVTPVNVDKGPATTAARIVYFDFDSFAIKDEFRPLIEAHAKRLTANRTQRTTIEGHTDERGGREYNLALGQKRAEAVKQRLLLMGARDAQIETVSFGKEKPRAMGSNEEAWAQNRRADIVYK